MNDMPAGPLEPWSGGVLDPFYRHMLGLPEVANAGNIAGMLADASQHGAPSSLLSAELNRAGAQGSLAPVIDFGVFQAAQEVQQLYSGVLPNLDEDDLLQTALPNEAKASASTKRATRRSAQAQSTPRGSSRQTAKTARSSAMSQSRSVVASIDQNSHSPDTSSHSDSDPEFQDIPAGDPDFAPAAREGASSGPKDSKAKLRDKNKRAQKRFRARQKDKAQQSERMLAEMAAQMQQLRVEKEELQGRNKLLESLLEVQQQQQHDRAGGRRLVASQEMEALMTGTGPLSDSLRRSDPYQPATLPTPTPPQQQPQAQLSQQQLHHPLQQPLAEQPITVSLLPGTLKLLTPTQVKNLSWQNHLKLYKAYVSRLAGLLQLSNGHEDSPAGKQVEALVIESVRLAAAKSLLDPLGMQQVFQARIRECRILTQRSQPAADMWPTILDALNLSRQQTQELMALRRIFLPKMGQLLKDRQRISRALQDSQMCLDEDVDPNGPCQQYTEATDVLRDLKSNLREDKQLLMQVLASVWRKIMRPYQLATVVVMAHPWVPDTGPVLDLVAQAEGEPPAQALMGTDKVPGTRGIGSWTLEWTGTFASSLTSEPDRE
ncbi:hypothetical protein WJX77_005455 [Trebouxia sp. C0004]